MEYSLFQIFITLVITTVLYKLFIKPIYRIKSLQKSINDDNNVETYFFPVIGFYKYVIYPDHQDDHHRMRELVKNKPDIKAYITNFASKGYIVLTDIQLIKEFLVEKSHLYRKFTLLVFSDFLFGQDLSDLQLKQRRELFAPVFHFDQLKSKLPMIESISKELVCRIKQQNQQNQNIHIISQMQRSTGDLLVKAFFGEEFVQKTINGQPISLEVADILKECAEITKSNPIAITRNLIFKVKTEQTPKFLFSKREKNLIKRMEDLNKLMKNEMLHRYDEFQNKECVTEDFLLIYIKAFIDNKQKYDKKQSNNVGQTKLQKFQLDFDFVFQQFMTIFVAGMDTTAHSTAMGIYLLGLNPQCQIKLREELQKLNVFQDDKNINNFEELKKAEYLSGCINEILRIYTPAPTLIPRIADKDHQIGSIFIKKGTFVDGMLLGCMNNPKYFPNPDKFDPERWIKREQPFKENPFSFIPFNAGPRNCLGQHLAILEMKIYLAYIVLNFNITENKDTQLTMISKPLYGPKDDNIVQLEAIN